MDRKIRNNKGKVNLIVVYAYGIGRETDKKEHSIGITLVGLILVEKSTNKTGHEEMYSKNFWSILSKNRSEKPNIFDRV